MSKPRLIAMMLACLAAGTASGQSVRVASWNLGWHVSQAEVPNWVERCGRSFVKDAVDGIWKPVATGTPGATLGWHIKESRAKLEGVDLSAMSPCGGYQTPARVSVAVTPAAFAQRSRQLWTGFHPGAAADRARPGARNHSALHDGAHEHQAALESRCR